MDIDSKKIWSITDLPDELIAMVLHKIKYNDVIAFGITCKRFSDVVFNNQHLWKTKCLEVLPHQIIKSILKYSNGNWFNHLKEFIDLKNNIITELLALSPKFYCEGFFFYRRMNQLTMEDSLKFFTIATKDELSYYYTVHVLQQVIKNAIKNLNQNICEKPHTLTEQHYAKVVLRYLMHTYLGIKWARLHKAQSFNGPPIYPELVLNFCVQWIDPAHYYSDERIADVLNEVVENVKDVIHHCRKSPQVEKKKITEREILSAVSQVLYGQKRIAITSAADLDTLNIVKVLTKKCGHAVAMAAIYHAVARKCGVNIKLIAFPNHLFLEWVDDLSPNKLYTISLDTGELKAKRRCPFSQVNEHTNYSYCSHSFLKYIYSNYLGTMGAIRNWNVQNCQHLLNFLGASDSYQNPYKNVFAYLIEIPEISAPDRPLNILYLENFYREIILSLTSLNAGCISESVNPREGNLKSKEHDKNVLYAVGMICYHKKYQYTCIIRDWDLSGDRLEISDDNVSRKQPFYSVTAADHSERYVAQENLINLPQPSRLYHLEDQISKDFCHFDGFAYVLNYEKRIQYPDEALIIEMYRNHSFTRA
ncbi:F-box only protein 21-like isoform X1 [Pieris napi]|uniref:F-box only protein 21-like isoform X1 n=1 Tax=Pieris napi TaxID=78633 RepID=UPI001FBB3377|nr:F-box only protein 21-like isoform X1 [Pieris napi]